MADETYAGEFYCVKCREKREAEGNVVVSNGRRMAKAVCPSCVCRRTGARLMPRPPASPAGSGPEPAAGSSVGVLGRA